MVSLAEEGNAKYDACSQMVYLKDSKIVRVIAHTALLVEIGGTTVLTLTAEKAVLGVPLEVTGGITATEDIVAGSISLQNHKHSGVQSGSADTGAPVG